MMSLCRLRYVGHASSLARDDEQQTLIRRLTVMDGHKWDAHISRIPSVVCLVDAVDEKRSVSRVLIRGAKKNEFFLNFLLPRVGSLLSLKEFGGDGGAGDMLRRRAESDA